MSSFGLNALSTTIASGQSQSSRVKTDGVALVGVLPASGSTLTSISFLGSVDGDNYYPIKNDTAAEYNPTVAGGVMTYLDLKAFLPTRFVKVRAGTSSAPSTQSVVQTVTILLKEI